MGAYLQMIYVAKRAEVLCAQSYALGNVLYLCPNRSILDFCRSMKLDAVLLSENMLGGFEPEMNDWAYRTTIGLVGQSKVSSRAEETFFIETNFYPIQSVLLQGAKFIQTLKFLVEKYKPAAIFWFRSSSSLFVSVCREYLASFHSNIQAVELAEVRGAWRVWSVPNFKKSLREFITVILNVQSRLLFAIKARKKKKTVFVSGGLNHLRAVFLCLMKKQALEAVFVEPAYDFNKHLFCLKRMIPYFVLPESKSAGSCFLKNLNFPGQERICFGATDYTAIFGSLFKTAHGSGLLRFPYEYSCLKRFFEKLTPGAVLLDEDLSVERRSLAVSAWQKGIPSFVISHGMPGQALRGESKRSRFLESSVTIVNSEFEKNVYTNIYFDPEKVVILGIPRYDELVSMEREGRVAKACSKERRVIVLLCLSGFHDYDFEAMMHVFVGADSLGEMNKSYIRDLLAVLSGRDNILLKIKPHYAQEEDAISQYIYSLKPDVPYRIESHRASTFRLENEANLIVTPESSVVIESLILKKSTVIVNYDRLDSPTPYKLIGFVPQARNIGELREGVSRILDGARFEGTLLGEQMSSLAFFSKYWDGHNAERVVDFIHSYLSRQPACQSKSPGGGDGQENFMMGCSNERG